MFYKAYSPNDIPMGAQLAKTSPRFAAENQLHLEMLMSCLFSGGVLPAGTWDFGGWAGSLWSDSAFCLFRQP